MPPHNPTDLLKDFEEYCRKNNLTNIAEKINTINTINTIKTFGDFEACCEEAYKEKQHQATILTLFGNLAKQSDFSRFMFEQMEYIDYIEFIGDIKAHMEGADHYVSENKQNIYQFDLVQSTSIDLLNLYESSCIKESDNRIIITSSLFQKYIQSEVDQKFRNLVKTMKPVFPTLPGRITQNNFYSHGKVEGNSLHLEFYSFSGKDIRGTDPRTKPARYADFTRFNQFYHNECGRWQTDLDNCRVSGTLSEEAHYHAVAAIRGFLRIFDVIATLFTTGRFEAGTYAQDKKGEHSFFKLPRSNKDIELKQEIKSAISEFQTSLESMIPAQAKISF